MTRTGFERYAVSAVTGYLRSRGFHPAANLPSEDRCVDSIQPELDEQVAERAIVRYAVLCAPEDEADARQLSDELDSHLRTSARHTYEGWGPWNIPVGSVTADEHRKHIDASDCLLVLLTARLLADGNVFGTLAAREAAQRLNLPVWLRQLSAASKVSQLVERFRPYPPDGRTFLACRTTDEKDAFARGLFDAIEHSVAIWREAREPAAAGVRYSLRVQASTVHRNVWLEIDWRHQEGEVPEQSVAARILRALRSEIDKLLFLSPDDFGDDVRCQVHEFARRSRIPVSLLDGPSLVALAGPDAPDAAGTPTLREGGLGEITCHLSRYAAPALGPLIDDTLDLEATQPLFAHFEWRGCGPELDIRVQPPPDIATAAVWRREMQDDIVLPYDLHRRTLVVWLVPGTVVRPVDLNVTVATSAPNAPLLKGYGRCTVAPESLPATSLPSHSGTITEIEGRVDRWMADGSVDLLLVQAHAGVGKSHLVRRLRRRWLHSAANEVTFDGMCERTAVEILSAAIKHLFPLSPDALGPDDAGAVRAWLKAVGLPEHASARFAQVICRTHQFGDLHSDAHLFGQLLSVIFRQAAARAPLVVVFEDLHKVLPSALVLLEQVWRSLIAEKRGAILFLATSRPYSDAGVEADHLQWTDQYTRLLAGVRPDLYILPTPTRDDACMLLRRAVPSFESYHHDAIIDQVGTTPFALGEALLFLELTGALTRAHGRPPYSVRAIDALTHAIETRELRCATEVRLRTLLTQTLVRWPWLDDFVALGACCGKAFPLMSCADLAGAPNHELRGALAELHRWDVLTVSTQQAGWVAFSHDLVRRAAWDAVVPSIRDHAATRLYRMWRARAPEDHEQLARFAYHAGLTVACVEHADSFAAASRTQGRLRDVVGAHALAIRVIDPDTRPAPLLGNDRASSSILEDDLRVPPRAVLSLPFDERWRRVLRYRLEILDALAEIGTGGSESTGRQLDEAEMLVEQIGTQAERAHFFYLRGRVEFARECVAASEPHHRRAEEIYSRVPIDECRHARIANLLRLVLCLRERDSPEADVVMRQCWSLRERGSWAFLAKFASRAGYLRLYNDWSYVVRRWRQASRIARTHRLAHGGATHSIGVAYIALLEGDLNTAEALLRQAEVETEDGDVDRLRTRVYLNLGNLWLLRGQPSRAIAYYQQAEQLGMFCGSARRLWRVEANLATAWELVADSQGNARTDSGDARRHMWDYEARCLGNLQRRAVLEEEAGTIGCWLAHRSVLPLMNSGLRQAEPGSPGPGALALFSDRVRATVAHYVALTESGRATELPGLLGRHAKLIGARVRFIVTE